MIPVLVYSGKSGWNLPLSFHDYLNFKSLELKKAFGENVLNYKYRLLNLNDLGTCCLRINCYQEFLYKS